MAWAALAMAAVKQIAEGVGRYQSGRENAAIASANARQAKLTAAAEANRQRRINIARESEFRAGVASQGTTFAGSPMEAYTDLVTQGEMEAQDRLFQGKLKISLANYQRDVARRESRAGLWGAITGLPFETFGGSSGGSGASGAALGQGLSSINLGGMFGNTGGVNPGYIPKYSYMDPFRD